ISALRSYFSANTKTHPSDHPEGRRETRRLRLLGRELERRTRGRPPPHIMACPTGKACSESLLDMDKCTSSTKSRYFVGISPAVVFVASLSVLAFLAVSLAACVVAATHVTFFFALPLASAAGGAFLVAAPEMTPFGADPAALLLLRAGGALAIAYAGSAMLVGKCCPAKVRSAHLALVAAALGTMAAALVADESSALAGDVGDKAAGALGRAAAAAAAGAVMSAAGPAFTRRIQSGKPAEPAVLSC
ncbi:unnamed protein product, partial [Ectocarpus sp. 12 AP-2014]